MHQIYDSRHVLITFYWIGHFLFLCFTARTIKSVYTYLSHQQCHSFTFKTKMNWNIKSRHVFKELVFFIRMAQKCDARMKIVLHIWIWFGLKWKQNVVYAIFSILNNSFYSLTLKLERERARQLVISQLEIQKCLSSLLGRIYV